MHRHRGTSDVATLVVAAVLASFFTMNCSFWDWAFDGGSAGPDRRAMQPIDLYFYDLNNGRLFVAKSDQLPPIDVPGGNPIQTPQGPKPAGVRAHVFACGECGDYEGLTAEEVAADGAYIAYLEMYTEAAKTAMTRVTRGDAVVPGEGMDPMEQTLVKRVEDLQWVQMYSQEGYQLADRVVKDCPDGSPARACRPD